MTKINSAMLIFIKRIIKKYILLIKNDKVIYRYICT